MEFKERRREFRNSFEGVRAANREFDAFHTEVISLIEEVKQTTSGIELQVNRVDWQIVIMYSGLELRIEWKCRFNNSLDNSELRLVLWDGDPTISYVIQGRIPKELGIITFQFDLLHNGEYHWNTASYGGRSLSTKDLAAFALKFLMEKIQETQLE